MNEEKMKELSEACVDFGIASNRDRDRDRDRDKDGCEKGFSNGPLNGKHNDAFEF